jgi:hypothetical protein
MLKVFHVLFLVVLAGCGGGGDEGPANQPEPLPPGKAIGGAGNDYGRSAQQTSDGGYVIAGLTNSTGAGGYDAWLIKTDATGSVIRQTAFGGRGTDFSYSVRQTQDGGFIATGVRNIANFAISPADPAFPIDLGGELFLRKMNANLEFEWEHTVTTAEFPYTLGHDLQQTSDGGYIVAGSAGFNLGGQVAFLLKTETTGSVLWNVGIAGELARCVRQTSDGGYIVSTGGLIKTDSTGSVLWAATLNGTAESVWNSSDGGYVVTGSVAVNAGDLYFAKTDANGNLLWERTFGSAGGDIGYSVQETADHGYIITGAGNGGGFDHRFNVYLVKTDANGNLQWQKYFGGLSDDKGRSVQQTSDGGYIVVGETASIGSGGFDVYLIKTDSNGDVQW